MDSRRLNRASLLLFAILLVLLVTPGDACITRSGHEGVCKNIKYCRSIMRKLMIHPSRRVLAELRQFNCGFDGMEPMVCCEKSGNSHEISTSTTTLTTTTTTTTTTTPRPRPEYREEPSRQMPEHDASSITATGQQAKAAERPDSRGHVHPNARLLDHELCGRSPALAKIYGGSETRLFEFPWMVLLKYNDSSSNKSSHSAADPEPFKCAGTIISRKYILTAAHCVAQLPNLKLAGVRIGEHDLSSEIDCESYGNDSALICAKKYRDLEIEWSLVHPAYSQVTWQNDIALVRLRGTMSFKPANVRPICLPLDEASSRALGPTALVTGWGSTEATYPSTTSRLRKVSLPIVDTDRCRKAYSDQPFMEISAERQLCAGGQEGRDSCSGDSGGPLQASGPYRGADRTIQHGIVSYGRQRCAIPGVPGVYTRVAPYVDWILDNMTE
ncbi:hypothetical protein TKK_0014184 [Trichogramma kaykai]|uniref:CLIP domain-containing serine protease n=1 Tax=Trichogramma kaykai TaxID=54128 RepID=A0ABD2WF19_9HYME